jgi:hypothetical protein
MNWQQTSPQFSPDLAGRVIILEAEPGQARDAVIQQWMAESRQSGAINWLLNCAYEEGGIWAGVADLFQELTAPEPVTPSPTALTPAWLPTPRGCTFPAHHVLVSAKNALPNWHTSSNSEWNRTCWL